MLSIYIIAAVIGGILTLIGAFAGESHHDGDLGIDGVGVDHGLDHDSDLGQGYHSDVWVPFFSVRFWTYFAMAFGLTGLLLTYWVHQVEPITATFSLITGLVLGLVVTYAIRALSRSENTSTISENEIVGAEAQVLVAIREGQLGRVRISVKGEILDLLAVSSEPNPLEAGSFGVVVEVLNDKVKVVSRESVFGSPEQLKNP